MKPFCSLEFDHVGAPTTLEQESEAFIEHTRAWVTNPRIHPANIEWLRFEADSPVDGPLRTMFHVAYRVDDLESAMSDYDVLLEPFEVGRNWAVVTFVLVQGVPVEFLQFHTSRHDEWWI
jgi:hypothetical protein